MTGRVHIVGVRHHSPSCARLVAHEIRRLRPRAVLVEGPADMNDRLDELLLPHRLPVAIFTFHREQEGKTESSWTPLCDYSPEWLALTVGREVGAELRFMDLPGWHPAFHGVTNRYGDHQRRRAHAVDALCRRFHIEGYDALWDHLFEGPVAGADGFAQLAARLEAYFHAVRGEDPPGERDGPREEHMRAWVGAALSRVDGPILVVCGGYHAPALEGVAAAPGDWPAIPKGEGAQSYLVPWSYHRLDSFTGYESGMPSPLFYDISFSEGPGAAPEKALQILVGALRAGNQHVSAADLIAALTLAQGLARVRGHDCLRRSDLLDGVAAALVKNSLDAPLPWSERGVVRRETDALLVEVLKALSGEREGRLHEQTPRPALLRDVEQTLEAHGLTPRSSARTVKLALDQRADLERSRVLHRLRVLAVPGFTRESGPTWTTDPELREVWTVARSDLAESALIEAASFGATLTGAAVRRLEEALGAEDLDLGKLATLLGEAVFVGIDGLTERALEEVRRHAARESDLARLGEALSRLLGLYTQDVLFGGKGCPELGAAVGETFDRGLWLLENFAGAGPCSDSGPIGAVRALRDVMREAGPHAPEEGCAVLARRADAIDAPPDIRGACLGALWSLGRLGDDQASSGTAVRAVRQASTPKAFGDFLAGLFALAREQTVHGDEVLTVVDEVLREMTEPDYLVALPALRLAFSYFPPREKAAIAERIAARHGKPAAASMLLTLQASAEVILKGKAADDEVELAMRRYALLPA
jgi:hypothetical protein